MSYTTGENSLNSIVTNTERKKIIATIYLSKHFRVTARNRRLKKTLH